MSRTLNLPTMFSTVGSSTKSVWEWFQPVVGLD